jgi:hypothetical protein
MESTERIGTGLQGQILNLLPAGQDLVREAVGQQTASAESPWERVPPEIVQQILSFLPDDELRRCERVCRKWYEVINDDSGGIWKQRVRATRGANFDLPKGVTWRDVALLDNPPRLRRYKCDEACFQQRVVPVLGRVRWRANWVARKTFILAYCAIIFGGKSVSLMRFFDAKAQAIMPRLAGSFFQRLRAWVELVSLASLRTCWLLGTQFSVSVVTIRVRQQLQLPTEPPFSKGVVILNCWIHALVFSIGLFCWPELNRRLGPTMGAVFGAGCLVSLLVSRVLGAIDLRSLGGPEQLSQLSQKELQLIIRRGLFEEQLIAKALVRQHLTTRGVEPEAMNL